MGRDETHRLWAKMGRLSARVTAMESRLEEIERAAERQQDHPGGDRGTEAVRKTARGVVQRRGRTIMVEVTSSEVLDDWPAGMRVEIAALRREEVDRG